MPDKKKYYMLDGQPIEVDEQHVGGFLSANPNAVSARAFVTPEKDTVVVEDGHVDGFLKAYPKATELYPVEKKNPIASPLQAGASPSSGVPLRDVAQPTPAQKIAPSVAGGLNPPGPEMKQIIPAPMEGDMQRPTSGSQESIDSIRKAIGNAKQAADGEITQELYKINGRPVSRERMRDSLHDTDFMRDVVSGKINVNIQDDEELGQLLRSQVEAGGKASDLWDSLKGAGYRMAAGVVEFQPMVNRVVNETINRLIPGADMSLDPYSSAQELGANDLMKKAEESEKKVFQYRENFANSLANGDFSDAGYQLLNTVSGSVPYTASAAALSYIGGPGLAFSVLAPIGSGSELASMNMSEDEALKGLSEAEKLTRAMAFGTLEAGADVVAGRAIDRAFGLRKYLLRDAIKQTGSEMGEGAAKELAKQTAYRNVKEFGKQIGMQALEEGVAEGGTTIGQMMTDDLLGVKDYKASDYLRDVSNAAMLGAFSGAGMTAGAGAVVSAPQVGIGVKRYYDNVLSSKDGKKNIKARVDSMEESGSITKEQAESVMSSVESREKAVSAVPSDQRSNTEVVDLVQEKQAVKEQEAAADDIFKPEYSKKIEELDSKIAELSGRSVESKTNVTDKQEDNTVSESPELVSGPIQKQPLKPMPTYRDQFTGKLSDFSDVIYRETNSDGILTLADPMRLVGVRDDYYFSNDPDLAIGQGKNKGFLIEADASKLKGFLNTSKPSYNQAYRSGSAELIARYNDKENFIESILSITVKPDAAFHGRLERKRFNSTVSGWDKIENSDGSITYIKPKQQNENAISKQRTETLGEQPVGKEGTRNQEGAGVQQGEQGKEPSGEGKAQEEVDIQGVIDSAKYKAKTREGVLIRLPIDFISEVQNPDYSVSRDGSNEIFGRIDRSKEHLRTKPTQLDASIIYIEESGKNKGKVSFQDGRHRLVAAKELGATHAMFEVHDSQVSGIESMLADWRSRNKEAGSPARPASEVFQNPVDAYNALDGATAQERDAFKEKHKNITARESVSVSDITPTQATIIENEGGKSGDGRPTLYRFDGKVYVLDGHNRIAKDIDSGKTEIDADVIDFDRANSSKGEDNVSEKLRGIADKIRQGKIHKKGGEAYSATPVSIAFDAALEAAALSVEAAATVAEAIDAALQSFRKSDWYKEASKRSRRKEERNLREQLLGGMSMSDIRAAQKEAMANKHYTKAPIVRVFSKIRPGDIPFSVLEDYIEALKGLSASVPNYDGLTVLMGRVVDAVEKGKASKANAKKAKAEEMIATKASVVDAIDEIASRDLSSINSIIKAENDLDAIMSALYDIEYDENKRPVESSTQILENEVSQLWMKAFKEKKKIQYQGKKEIDDMADNVLDIMSEVSAANQHRRWSQPQQDLYYDLFSLLHQRGADAKAMLKKLPLSQLATLEALVSNMMPITVNNGANMTSSGEVDVARLSPIVDRLYSVSKDADAFIEDAEKIASKSSDDVISEFASRASANEVQRQKDLLGIKITERSKFLDTLTQLYETGMTAYNEELRAGLDHITKAKKAFGIKQNSQRRKIGVIAIYIRDYLDGKAEQGGGMRDYWKNVMYKVKDGNIELDDKGNPKINTNNMRNMDSVKSLADMISAVWFAAGRAKSGAKATSLAIGKVVKDIESVRSSIPAELRVGGDPNGDIDPKKVWGSYAANDGKALTKEERAFLESIVSYSESHLGYMQEAANEARGLPFKWIPFYVRRTVKRGSVGNVSANPNATARRGSIRLSSSTGKDATDMAATPVEYDIEKMFTHALEQTARDYHVGKTVRRANALLSRLSMSDFENASLLATSAAEYMSQMLTREFIRNVSPIDRAIGSLVKVWVMNTMANAVRTIREHAIAGTTLFLRTGRPIATVRAQIASKEKKGELLDLMHFLGSPLILKAITNKHMDMAGSEIRNPTLAEEYLRLSSASSEPMIVRSTWFPEFKDAFKKETGEDFDMSKFNNDPEYRYEYRSEMLSASTTANLAVYSIIGPALSGQRVLNAQLIPFIGASGRFSTQSPMVKQIMLFTGFSNRERQQLVNGLVGAAEGLASGDPETAAREASKTVGTAISVLAYGITGTMQFILSGYVMSALFGDDDEKEKWAKEWRDFTSGKSAFDEVIRATAGLALSKYGAVSRGMATIAASILYNSTDDKEMKEYIRKSMKDNLYSEPISMSSNKYSSEPTVVELIGEMMASARAIARMADMGSKFVSSVGELIEGEEDRPVEEQTLADRQDEKDAIDAVNVAYSAAVLALTVNGMPMFERATFDKIIDRLNKHPLTQKDIDDKNAVYNKMLFSEIEDSIEKEFPSQRSAGKDMPKNIEGGDRYGYDIIRKDDPRLQEIISDAVKKYRPSSSNKIILSDYELSEDSGDMVAKNVENMRVRLNAKRLGYVGGDEGAMSEDPVAYTDLLSTGKGGRKGMDGVVESLIPSSKSWTYKEQNGIYRLMLGMKDAGILSKEVKLGDFREALDKRRKFIDEMEKRIAKKKK